LTAKVRARLEQLARAHTTAQVVVMCVRIVLMAEDGSNNGQIARRFGLAKETVRKWRHRWIQGQDVPLAEVSVEERLKDAPRSGAPTRIGSEQVCAIAAVACEAPAQTGRPISQWTGREIAIEEIARGIVQTISPRHAARLLKRGISNRTKTASGYCLEHGAAVNATR
jgi:putative transposase